MAWRSARRSSLQADASKIGLIMDRLPERELTLVLTVARAVLHGDRGMLANQLDRPAPEREGRDAVEWPEVRPGQAVASREEQAALETPSLRLFNGLGGFTADGKEGVDAFLGKRAPRWPERSQGRR